MAKIKIQGNASGTGTLTLTAPNTNSDRTHTLPDVDGTLVANTSTGIDVTGALAVNSGTTDTAATFTSSDASVAVNFIASDNSMQIATSGTDGIIKNNGAGSFRLFNNGSEKMRIDSAGRVTMPNQPTATWKFETDSAGFRTYTAYRNVGNHLSAELAGNGSTMGNVGRFTAPVTGMYHISIGYNEVTRDTSNALISCYGSFSATNTLNDGKETLDLRGTGNQIQDGGRSDIVYLAATDYISFDYYRPVPTTYLDTAGDFRVSISLAG